MNGPDSSEEKALPARRQSGVVDSLMERLVKAINDADEAAASERVAELRQKRTTASSDDLVEVLIKQKCMQTGAIGAVTSGASMIPGLGTFVSLTFGVAADIGLTFKLQAELVLEIAAVYQRNLNPAEKRHVVMLATGISAGANQVVSKVGQRVARKATERLAQKSVTKAIPVIGVCASAGTNILTTYVIGRRAQAYFSLGPEVVGDWGESVRAVTGVDERKITNWLAETTERSWGLVSDSAGGAAGAVIVAGKSAGEVVVGGAGKAGQAVAGVGKGLATGAGAATGAVVGAGKKVGEEIVTGVGRAGEAVAGAGRNIAKGTRSAPKRILNVFKRPKSGKEEKTSGKEEGKSDEL